MPRAPAARYPGRPVVLLLVCLALAACSPVRGLDAWALLDDLAAGEGPSRLKETTPEPRREAVAYEVEGRAYRGDLYRPGQDRGRGRGAPLVLVPGAAPEGKDDPRLVAIAKTLARSRFLVLVPDIASLRALNVSAADAKEIAAALRHLADTTELDLGLVAISYAVGPAVIAALEPLLRARLRFLIGIGGYYDLEAVIAFFTTDRYRDSPGSPWRTRRANAYGKWVFVRSNAARLDDLRDRVLLTGMAERKLRDLSAPIDDIVPKLGPQGRTVYALLANRDPDQVPALIAALPQGVRDEIAALDLKTRDLSGLRAEVILVHGRDDPIIPETESVALAAALPQGRAHLYLPDNLMHADFQAGGGDDGLVLLPAAYRLLRLRDEVLASGGE